MLRVPSAILFSASLCLVGCDPGWRFGSELSVDGHVSRECVDKALERVPEIASGTKWSNSSVEYQHGTRKGFMNIEVGRVTIGWSELGRPPGNTEAASLREISEDLSAKVLASCHVEKTGHRSFCQVDGATSTLCD